MLSTIIIPITRLMSEIRIDSDKNWFISLILVAPVTFLIPTSFALFADLAVLRFMKLMQAMARIKAATTIKIEMYFWFPFASNSPAISEFR